MNPEILHVHKIGKQYQLGESNHFNSFRDKFDAWIHNKNAPTRQKQFVWALRNISFTVNQGDVLGIIGKNGAGKSTLLKILSRITLPSEGRISIKGRVSSLLEVGTGFHPELTGRENIYLNGSIMGMKKWEIDAKFDAIVAFSEIEKFIDTPAKRYSSGMYLRLAFAVAAHLEPEVLLVDEVLAVGDHLFQKKCLKKMNEISKDGRTVLFVSHNLDAISKLCSRAILISQGSVSMDSTPQNVINHYLCLNEKNNETMLNYSERSGSKTWGEILEFKMVNDLQQPVNYINMKDSLFFIIRSKVYSRHINPEVGIVISNQSGTRITHLISTWYGGAGEQNGEFTLEFKLNEVLLYPGDYQISIWLRVLTKNKADDFIENISSLTVHPGVLFKNVDFTPYNNMGGIYSPAVMKITK